MVRALSVCSAVVAVVVSVSVAGGPAGAVGPASFSSTTVTFAATTIGGTSYAHATVTNTSSTPETVMDTVAVKAPFAFAGSDASFAPRPGACWWFTDSSGGRAGVTLQPGDHCLLYYAFNPTAVTGSTGTTSVAVDAGAGPVITKLTLKGVGSNVKVVLSPTTLDFGKTVTAFGTADKTTTVTNNSTIAIQLAPSAPSGTNPPYRVLHADDSHGPLPSNCFTTAGSPVPVPAGGSCLIYVRYAPVAATATTSTIKATFTGVVDAHQVPKAIATANLALKGTALKPTLGFDHNPLVFGNVGLGGGVRGTYTATNTSTIPVDIISITTTGSYGIDVANDDCSPGGSSTGYTHLEVGQSCHGTLIYYASAAGGQSGTLKLALSHGPVGSNGRTVDSIVALNLKGTGVKPVVTITPSPVKFGQVHVGNTAEQTITLTNTSSVDILAEQGVTSPATGPYFLPRVPVASGTDPCVMYDAGHQVVFHALLHPGESCTMLVDYSPTKTGSVNGVLKVNLWGVDYTSASPSTPQDVATATASVSASGTAV